MLEQHFKKNSTDKDTNYGLHLELLENEISILRKALNSLVSFSTGIDAELDKQLLLLEHDLHDEPDKKLTIASTNLIINSISTLLQKKRADRTLIKTVIEKSLTLITAIAMTAPMKAASLGMESLLKTGADDQQLLKEFLNFLAVSIDEMTKKLKNYEQNLKNVEKKMKELPKVRGQVPYYLDPLTQLPTKIFFEERLMEAYHRWRRGYGDLSIALAAVELPSLGENYERSIDDELLKKIAAILKKSIRAVDCVCRYSENEFIFIFERTHLQNAAKVVDGLRASIEEEQFFYKDKKIQLHIAFGVSALNTGETLEELFLRARKALYD